MDKLIIFEGPDGVGKTTQISMLREKFNTGLLVQPNPDSLMSFKDFVFTSKNLTPIEMQLFFALSHMYDLYEKVRSYSGTLIMDRSYLSGLVYGSALGADVETLEKLALAMRDVHVKNLYDVDVRIVFMLPKNRLNKTSDDIFEKNTKWEGLLDGYKELCRATIESSSGMFSSREKVLVVDNSNMTIEETHDRITKFIR